MPWDGSNNYQYPPGTEGIPDQTIESVKYNTFIADLRDNDLNKPRPITRGGTGAADAVAALANLGGEKAQQVVINYDAMTWLSGSFYSAASATASPVAGHRFVGMVSVQDTNNIAIQAFDLDSTPAGELYTKIKKDGVWQNSGAWGTGFVKKSGDTMSGPLNLAQGDGTKLFFNDKVALQHFTGDPATYMAMWDGSYNGVGSGTGFGSLWVGGGTDPSNYYQNTLHSFGPINGAAFTTIDANKVDIKQTTPSTSTTTGALTVAGGAGIGGQLSCKTELIKAPLNSGLNVWSEDEAIRGVMYVSGAGSIALGTVTNNPLHFYTNNILHASLDTAGGLTLHNGGLSVNGSGVFTGNLTAQAGSIAFGGGSIVADTNLAHFFGPAGGTGQSRLTLTKDGTGYLLTDVLNIMTSAGALIANFAASGLNVINGGIQCGPGTIVVPAPTPGATIATAANSSAGFEIRSQDAAKAAYMAFHRPSAYASYFGLDSDNEWKVGGWSAGAVSNRIFHEGSYAPPAACYLSKVGANLVLSRYNGRYLWINGRAEIIPSAGVTLAPFVMLDGTNYIYAYMNAGVMTLHLTSSAPGVDTTFGHKILAGNPAYSLVGMVYTLANAFIEDATRLLVLSYYNRRVKAVISSFGNVSTGGPAFNPITGVQLAYLTWGEDASEAWVSGQLNMDSSSGQFGHFGVTDNGTLIGNPHSMYWFNTTGGAPATAGGWVRGTVGYHVLTPVGGVNGAPGVLSVYNGHIQGTTYG